MPPRHHPPDRRARETAEVSARARGRDQQVFVLRVTPKPGVDAIRALRALLKTALRRHGLRALSIRQEDEVPSS
jgi:hypothetical protein